MHKTTERGKSAGLLELEQAHDPPRSYRRAETATISEPLLEETVDPEVARTVLRERRRGRRGSKFPLRFSTKNRSFRIAAVFVFLVALGLVTAIVWGMKSVMLHNPHFLLESTGDIQVTGNRVVPARKVVAFFAPDLGRSVFRVPLIERQDELNTIPWVRRATVMRLWPDRLAVHLVERTPIAFARDGNTIRLVDDDGVLLDLPAAAAPHYSFPVLTGLSSSEPLATRAALIERYRQFVQALDAQGDHVSASLSEVDLSDPEDVRAVFTGGAHPPVVHFGAANFLARYLAYRAHLAEWLQQYPALRSVDMRYGRQVVLDTGEQQATTSPKTAQAVAGDPRKVADAHPAKIPPGRTRAVRTRTNSRARRRNVHAARRRRAYRHARRRAPEHGHRVRRPIMHVVTGI